jgi:hypothetical protein
MWSKREDGAPASAGVAVEDARGVPGKQTLTSALPAVQRRADGAGAAAGDVAAIAQRGVAGPGQALPHGGQIQALFGRHDVSGVQAHVGGAAGSSCAAGWARPATRTSSTPTRWPTRWSPAAPPRGCSIRWQAAAR